MPAKAEFISYCPSTKVYPQIYDIVNTHYHYSQLTLTTNIYIYIYIYIYIHTIIIYRRNGNPHELIGSNRIFNNKVVHAIKKEKEIFIAVYAITVYAANKS